MITIKIKCPICGEHEFSYANSYEICPVCEWENCEFQYKYQDDDAGPNGMSMNDYRNNWMNKKKHFAVA